MQLSEWLEKQREWSLKTFGPGRRTLGLVEHIRKELAEIEADPTDPMEWVDVMILAFDGSHRTNADVKLISDEFEKLDLTWDIYHIKVTLAVLLWREEKQGFTRFNNWVAIAHVAKRALYQMGYTWPEILAMLTAKQLVNFARQWPPWRDQDQPTEHVRGEE